MYMFRYFLELPLNQQLFIITVILVLSFVQAFIYRFKALSIFFSLVILNIFLFLFLKAFSTYSLQVHLFYYSPSFLLSLLVYNLFLKKEVDTKDPMWSVSFKTTTGKDISLENIKRGVLILGSAGAGKTESVFVPLLKHTAEKGFSVLNYDYKDGELTEIANYFFQNSGFSIYNVIPHKPELSHRINPILPAYLDSSEMVSELVSVFFSNTRSKGSDKNFFQDVPESVLAGTIWRLRCDYPHFCTLPHAISVCITKEPQELADFLEKNPQSRILASPFFDSLIAKDQMAGVKASLSNELRKFAFPSIFYILSDNEVNLNINNPASPALLNLINSPDREFTQSSFLALIFTMTIKLMQKRGMRPSTLMLDEAATLNIPNFSRIPAAMRSYNIATIYSLQDKVLGTERYGDAVTRAILSNLSYQFIGKTNDPESVKHYKQIVEEIEKKNYSKSYGDGLMAKGESRTTESYRETSKYKNQDFFGLKTGEFIVLSDGKDHKVKLKLTPFERVTLKVKHHVTSHDLERNFNDILLQSKSLI